MVTFRVEFKFGVIKTLFYLYWTYLFLFSILEFSIFDFLILPDPCNLYQFQRGFFSADTSGSDFQQTSFLKYIMYRFHKGNEIK